MNELHKILDIASGQCEENTKKDFLNQKLTDESSYVDRKKDLYIQKMDFDTPVKLQKQLQQMWYLDSDMQRLEKIIVVAAFKMRDSEGIIPEEINERVYNF